VNAVDIMSAPVISIAPDTPIHEIAALLLERHISGVPVLDKGRVVGLVNEFELLRRREIGTDGSVPERSWWTQLIERDPRPVEYVKSHAQRATDLMTRQVISVTEDTSVQMIASIFAARAVRRIVVLREQQLVGIVTRTDLVHALALKSADKPLPRTQSDESIRVRLLAELESQPWWRPSQSAVSVVAGVVQYRGLIESEDERSAARVAAENVPGVRRVEDTRTVWTNWQSMF
jgi:CBS domain-containing protein